MFYTIKLSVYNSNKFFLSKLLVEQKRIKEIPTEYFRYKGINQREEKYSMGPSLKHSVQRNFLPGTRNSQYT